MTFDPTKVTSNTPEAATKFKNATSLGKLSDLYKMRIRLCDKEGVEQGDEQVIAVAIDAELSVESQYSNPFDQSNPEHKLPTLMGMLQSGDWVNTLDTAMNSMFGIQLSGDKKEQLNTLQGKSNLTKQNSTNIFVSTQPVSIPATLYFGAWEDAEIEVENQVRLLQKWSLPVELAEGSLVSEFAENMSLESLFPSTVPPYVAIYYGGKRYFPLLINSCSAPMVVPMDGGGNRMQLQVQVNFLSRTAWDAKNIDQIYSGT